MKHNKVMNVGAVISLASPEVASLSPSKPSISQLASLLAAPWTQTVQSFLSRKIAPTKNVSIFLWTIPGIPGTSRRDKKTCAHSIEMCVHVVGKPPKGCVCTQWNSGVRETATHQQPGTEANPVSAELTSAAPLPPGTRGQCSGDKSIPSTQTNFPEFCLCLFFSLLRFLGSQPYETLASLRGSS